MQIFKFIRMKLMKHPIENCMSYSEHAKLSLQLGQIFLQASAKAMVHALIPSLYVTSSSEALAEANDLLNMNGCKK